MDNQRYEITLTEKSQKNLVSGNGLDLGKYRPDVDSIQTLYDFRQLLIENIAARVYRERVYMTIAHLIMNNRWRDISTVRITCYKCGTQTDMTDLLSLIEDMNVCPYCQSTETVIEPIPAFEDEYHLFQWCKSNLSVGKRSIMLRVEYYKRCLALGLSEEDIFAGIATHGVSWMKLARRLEQSVTRGGDGDVNIEEAKMIMQEYDNPDFNTSSIEILAQELSEKDEVEVIATENGADIIVQAVSPAGKVKWKIYYMAVPLHSAEVDIDFDNFWKTTIGNMVARRLKVLTDITYGYGIGLVPDFDFTDIWKRRMELLRPVRRIVHYIIQKSGLLHMEADIYSNKEIDNLGPLSLIRVITEYVSSLIPKQLDTVSNLYEELSELDDEDTIPYD